MSEVINRNEILRVAGNMKRYGGSFVESLGKALLQADEDNQKKIKATWPEYWEHYNFQDFHCNVKKEEKDIEDIGKKMSDLGIKKLKTLEVTEE